MLTSTAHKVGALGAAGFGSRVLTVAVIIGSFLAFGWVLSDAVQSAEGLTPKHWVPLAAAAVLHFLMLFFLMRLWEGVLRTISDCPADQDAPPRSRLYTLYSRSWLARYIPGRIWSLAGRTLLAKKAGVPASDVARSVVIEVVLTYGMVSIISGAVLAGVYIHPVSAPALFVVSTALVAATLMNVRKLPTALSKARWIPAVRTTLIRAAKLVVVPSSATWANTFKGIALYCGYSCLQLAFIVLIAAAFTDLDAFTAAVIAGTWGLSLAIGWLSFVPPVGLGARDGLALVFFSQVLDVPAASSIVVASRIVMLATDLAFVAAVECLGISLNRRTERPIASQPSNIIVTRQSVPNIESP